MFRSAQNDKPDVRIKTDSRNGTAITGEIASVISNQATGAVVAETPQVQPQTTPLDVAASNNSTNSNERRFQEPIPANVKSSAWERKLQMPMIPPQTQARIYAIKLQVPILGQAVSTGVKALTSPDALSYQELTGGLGENDQLVQAWIM
jgi:hypothetical protein